MIIGDIISETIRGTYQVMLRYCTNGRRNGGEKESFIHKRENKNLLLDGKSKFL